jgi:hypothetical protein
MIMEITMKYEKEKEKNSHRVQGLAILFWFHQIVALIKHFLDCSSCTSDGTGTVVLRKNLINVRISFFIKFHFKMIQ